MVGVGEEGVITVGFRLAFVAQEDKEGAEEGDADEEGCTGDEELQSLIHYIDRSEETNANRQTDTERDGS